MDDNSFFSVDRLIEFGLGMSMAQQMITIMNQSMQKMYIPGSIQAMPKPHPNIYYVAISGQQIGPLNDSELSNLIRQKKVDKDTLSWMPGMQTWQPVANVPAILRLVAMTPPPIPTKE